MPTAKRYRAHGEGSITVRKGRPKPYLAQITVRGKRLSQSFGTKIEAVRWLQDIQNKSQSVADIGLLTTSLEQAANFWLEYVRVTKATKTYLGYKRVADKYLTPQIGKLRIFEVKPLDLQEILTTYSKQASERELLYIWQTFSSFFGYLVLQGVLPQNPAKSVARPRQNLLAENCRYLSQEQARKLVRFAEDRHDPLVDLYYFALSTGMREGEILGLRWNNVNWDAQSILVVEQVQWNDQRREGKVGYEFQAPKTTRSKRRIPVGAETIRRLRSQQHRNAIYKQFAKERWKEHDLVFPSEAGTPMEPTNLIRRFKGLLKSAELPNVRIHDLRHTHATLLLLRGAHPKVVSERLGHADIITTLKVYSHVIPTLQEAVAGEIENVLEQSPKISEMLSYSNEIALFESEL